MAESFLYYSPFPGPEHVGTLLERVRSAFSVIDEYRPGRFETAELEWKGRLEVFTPPRDMEIRWVHCQASLDSDVSTSDCLTSVLSGIPEPPYRFSLSFGGRLGAKPSSGWLVWLEFSGEVASIVVTPPRRERNADGFESIFRLLGLPHRVLRHDKTFSLVDGGGESLRSLLGSPGGAPGNFQTNLECRTWQQLMDKVRPLLDRISPNGGWRWTAVLGHDRDSSDRDLGKSIYAAVSDYQLPVTRVLLLMEYVLPSLDCLDEVSALVRKLERGAFRARLSQFRIGKEEVASLEAVATGEGSFLELEVRNPDVVATVEDLLGCEFEPDPGGR